MRVVNNPKRNIICSCSAELEFDNSDIIRGGDSFRHEKEEYIICPNCKRKIILISSCNPSTPYD